MLACLNSVAVKALKYFLLALVILVLVDAIALFLNLRPPALSFLLHDLPFRGQSFDQKRWHDALPQSDLESIQCYRGAMVRDLIRNHLKPNLTSREQAVALLGPPTRNITIGEQSCTAYSLGYCSGFGWDPDSLYLCFDEQNKLHSAGTVQH